MMVKGEGFKSGVGAFRERGFSLDVFMTPFKSEYGVREGFLLVRGPITTNFELFCGYNLETFHWFDYRCRAHHTQN